MRPSLLVGVALLLGALTALFMARWLEVGRDQTRRVFPQIVVAASAIDAGTVVSAAQLKTVEWHAPEMPLQALQDVKAVIGRVTRYPLQPGEPLLESKLAPADTKAGLSAVITPGKRAISVRVNEVIGVAGFAMPGNFVDVLVSGKDNDQNPFSRVVITRAKVLAVAQDTMGDPGKPKVSNAVTLELTPAEAERLDLARSIGTLSLVLRNESDASTWNSAGARMPDILNGGAAPARAAASASASAAKPPRTAGTEPRVVRETILELRGTARNEVRP